MLLYIVNAFKHLLILLTYLLFQNFSQCLRIRGWSLIIDGGVVHISTDVFFFGNPPNKDLREVVWHFYFLHHINGWPLNDQWSWHLQNADLQLHKPVPAKYAGHVLMSGRGLRHCQTFWPAWFNTQENVWRGETRICQAYNIISWSSTEKNVRQRMKMCGSALKTCRTKCPADPK